jgi:hypothetical protein
MISSSTDAPTGVEDVEVVVASVEVEVVVVDAVVDERPDAVVEGADAESSSEHATALTVMATASVASRNLQGLGGASIRLIRSDSATAAPPRSGRPFPFAAELSPQRLPNVRVGELAGTQVRVRRSVP